MYTLHLQPVDTEPLWSLACNNSRYQSCSKAEVKGQIRLGWKLKGQIRRTPQPSPRGHKSVHPAWQSSSGRCGVAIGAETHRTSSILLSVDHSSLSSVLASHSRLCWVQGAPVLQHTAPCSLTLSANSWNKQRTHLHNSLQTAETNRAPIYTTLCKQLKQTAPIYTTLCKQLKQTAPIYTTLCKQLKQTEHPSTQLSANSWNKQSTHLHNSLQTAETNRAPIYTTLCKQLKQTEHPSTQLSANSWNKQSTHLHNSLQTAETNRAPIYTTLCKQLKQTEHPSTQLSANSWNKQCTHLHNSLQTAETKHPSTQLSANSWNKQSTHLHNSLQTAETNKQCTHLHNSLQTAETNKQCTQCLSHNTMPPYLSDLLHSYQPPRTLRSLDTSLLSVPRFCLETFGQRSFSVFGPTVWNSLPLPLRKTQCFSTFKKKLKTHLFEKHLSWYLQACSSVYVAQLVCVCVCVCVCACACAFVCDTLFMVMTAGMMYMMLWNDSPLPPHNMYVYFLCGLVCTCIHESDAELICVCFSQTF